MKMALSCTHLARHSWPVRRVTLFKLSCNTPHDSLIESSPSFSIACGKKLQNINKQSHIIIIMYGD